MTANVILVLAAAVTLAGSRVVPHDPNHRLMRPWIGGGADLWAYRDENDRLIMYCDAHADPTPDVTWYKNGLRVSPNFRRHIRDDFSLDIRMADMIDTGTYQCRAANQYGMARKTYHIIIMPDSLYK